MNSIVLPNTGTYLIQGQQTVEGSFEIYCFLSASPVQHPLANLGLSGGIAGSSSDAIGTWATIPITGYFAASVAPTTITLWCGEFSDGEGYAYPVYGQATSLLTALQVQ